MATDQSQENATSGEFERQPVPKSSLLGFRSFIGMYAGEHCAGTELLIGPMFVAAGVSAYDLIVGLILGNLLAVISWMVLCAPIATRSRLTLYYQLEKICGRNLVTLYNLANGVMFCFLAGAMITVSATAVGVWIKFPMPELNQYLPNSVGWVIASGTVGLLIAIVAALGYRTVSKFANIAAPWMVLVFLAFGLVALRNFINTSGQQVSSLGDLWTLSKDVIWTGGEAIPGQTKFTFWHVMFFAWFCNMAMHVGMSDLSVFRFAKKSWYASASGAGMFVGHFMAWIAASLLFALPMYVFLRSHDATSLTELLSRDNITDSTQWDEAKEQWGDEHAAWVDAGSPAGEEPAEPFPSIAAGPLAANACGLVGLLCVIIAGWTTANPTIYRAGLAFQAVIPKSNRVLVTFCTGVLATVVGIFPAVAMKLLDFVAIYGLLLMPMGAVIFVDFWLYPKLGLKQYFAEKKGISFNWAAGIAWLLTLGICVAMVKWAGIQIFFVSLPGWFIAVVLYIVVGYIFQGAMKSRPDRSDDAIAATAKADNQGHDIGSFASEDSDVTTPELPPEKAFTSMLTLLGMIGSGIALAGVIVPPLLYFAGSLELDKMKYMMLVATIAWMVISPLWMWKDDKSAS